MPPLLGVVMTLVQDTVLFCGVIPSAKSKNTEQTQKKSKPEGKGKILVSKPAKREVGCNADTVHNQCIDAQFGCTICRGYLLVLQFSLERRKQTEHHPQRKNTDYHSNRLPGHCQHTTGRYRNQKTGFCKTRMRFALA